MKISTPIYLLRSETSCWKCGAIQEVIALASEHVSDEDDEEPEEDELALLEKVEMIPADILECIRARHPAYEKRKSKTAGSTYYMNVCTCGAHFGDHFLQSEPGGAFFPQEEEQAALITIEQLPFSGTFDFKCGCSWGEGAFIFEHAKRVKKP